MLSIEKPWLIQASAAVSRDVIRRTRLNPWMFRVSSRESCESHRLHHSLLQVTFTIAAGSIVTPAVLNQ